MSMLGYTSAVMGEREKAEEILQELQSLAGRRYVPPYNFALVHNGLRNDHDVFKWLERAHKGRDVLLAAFIKADPVWSRFRNDARYTDLLRRMKLL